MRLIIFLLLFSFQVFALKEFYSISRSIRAMGMGGAYYGLSNDEYALFYNPAGLGLMGSSASFMPIGFQAYLSKDVFDSATSLSSILNNSNYGELIESLQGRIMSVGATILPYYVRKNFAIGILVSDLKVNTALLGGGLINELDITAINDSGIFIGKAFPILKDLFLGANLKFIYRIGGRQSYDIVDIAKGSKLNIKETIKYGMGLDFDVALTKYINKPLIGEKMALSLVFNNLLASGLNWFTNSDQNIGLVRTISFGTFTLFSFSKYFKTAFLLDISEFSLGGETDAHLGGRGGTFFKHLNFGVEIPLAESLLVRSGFHQGSWTFGIGVMTKVFKLDFATYGEELADNPGIINNRRYMLRLTFGYLGSPYHNYYEKSL